MERDYEDISVTCVNCGVRFLIPASVQKYYKEHGYKNLPKRCLDCRNAINKMTPFEPFVGKCRYCKGIAIVPFKPVNPKTIACEKCFNERKAKHTD